MKRVYLILTLFMTSFFLLSSNVIAEVITLPLTDDDFSFINDKVFKIRELAIEYANQNNKEYIINYMSIGGYDYFITFFSKTQSISVTNINNRITLDFPSSGCDTYYYNSSSNSLVLKNYRCSGDPYLDQNSTYYARQYIDSSLNYIPYTISDNDLVITYKDLSYLITLDSHVPSLYEIYNDYQLSQVDPKSEIITNFYVLIIDKIKLLANYITTDYIILSALVIFIFVAVIGLVRRLK